MATQKTRTKPPRLNWKPSFVPPQKGLYIATDHRHPITLEPSQFIPVQRDQGWGPFAENFIRANEIALRALGAELILSANKNGPILQLRPGNRAGAIPLKSSHTGKVCSGFIVKPRFGWAGVGHILSKTGWHAAPQFLPLPAVPGSGREIPPWVIAGGGSGFDCLESRSIITRVD